jgi:hypothetical protein
MKNFKQGTAGFFAGSEAKPVVFVLCDKQINEVL